MPFLVGFLLTYLLCACSASTATPSSSKPIETFEPIQLGPTETATPITPSPTAPPPTPTSAGISPITKLDWHRGPDNAPITFLVYVDFQCPYSKDLYSVLLQLEERRPDEIRIVFRHFPLLPLHDKASLAGQAVEAAGSQGHFWEMVQLLFEHQSQWETLPPADFPKWLQSQLQDTELDQGHIIGALAEARYKTKMEQDFYSAISAGLAATPTLFLNDKILKWNPTLPVLEAAVRIELLEDQKWDHYPPTVITPSKDYYATLRFNLGEVKIQLYVDSAPLAVNSFVFLSREGWFENNPIFHVQPGVLVELGDPSGTGLGDPGYHYETEIDPTLIFDQPGLVALSSSGPATNASIFFITLTPLPELNGTRTIFGRVLEGLDLFMDLPSRDPLEDLLNPPEAILQSVTIEER